MVYPHCPCHAHFSTNACHGLPSSPVSYAHHLSIFGRLRPAFSLDCKKIVRQHQFLPAYVDIFLHKCQPMSGIPWLYHLLQEQRSSDLHYGLPSSPFSCIQWLANVERGLPATPLTCTQWSVHVICCLHSSPLLHAMINQSQTWDAPIIHGLHTSSNGR